MSAGEDAMFDQIAREAQLRRLKTETDIKNSRIARVAEDLMIHRGNSGYSAAELAVDDAKQIIKMIDRVMNND